MIQNIYDNMKNIILFFCLMLFLKSAFGEKVSSSFSIITILAILLYGSNATKFTNFVNQYLKFSES